jgi:hypothetical protein
VLVSTELGVKLKRAQDCGYQFASNTKKPIKKLYQCAGRRSERTKWRGCAVAEEMYVGDCNSGRLIGFAQEKSQEGSYRYCAHGGARQKLTEWRPVATWRRQVGDILKGDRKSDVMKTRLCLYSASYPVSAKKMWNGEQTTGLYQDQYNSCQCDTFGTPLLELGDDEDEDGERSVNVEAGPMELAKIPSHVTQTVQYCADADEKVKRLTTTLTKIRNDETKAKEGRRPMHCVLQSHQSQAL